MTIRTIVCILILSASLSAGQNSIAPLMDYLGVKVTKEDQARLETLQEKAQAPGLTAEQRSAAYSDLFSAMWKLQGIDAPKGRLDFLVQTAVSWSCPENKAAPVSRPTPPNTFAHVEKRGSGKQTMVLIPDAGFDWKVYESFMQRNAGFYTMYAVTLPGFGGTPSIARFDHRNYAQKRLWGNAEEALVRLMKSKKMQKPLLVGVQAGAYLAMRTALDHPDSVGGVVVLNGLLSSPMNSRQDPKRQASIAEREAMSASFLPIELFPLPSPVCYAHFLDTYSSIYSKDPDRVKALVQDESQSDARIAWDYTAELLTTDLTGEIENLKVPLLAIPSVPDAKSPLAAGPNPGPDQWKGVKSPLVTVVTFEDTRAYATEDNPEKLDETIRKFVNNKDEPHS